MTKTIGIMALFAAAGLATAGPTGTDVAGAITIGNSGSGFSETLASGLANQAGIAPAFNYMGTNWGNAVNGSDVQSDYAVVQNGADGSGANGGNVYTLTGRFGSRAPGRFGEVYYGTSIIAAGDTLSNGNIIDTITLEFGVGGGGIAFDDFGAATQVSIVEQYGSFLHLDIGQPFFNFDEDVSGNNAQWVLNGDGTVGMSWTVDASALYYSNVYDATADVAGDFAGFLNGIKTTVKVEVTPTPASAALLGLGGLVATRRRRG